MQDQLAANASYNWDDLEALTQGCPLDKAGFALVAAGSGGSSLVKVGFKHGARHLIGTGLSSTEVEKLIVRDIQNLASEAEVGVEWRGHVGINGQVIQYWAHQVSEGAISVGTYVIPRPGRYIVP